MSRLFTVLNYFCIAICAVGIYSSYRLLSLKPWKVNNLETKLAVQLDKWEAPRFGLATTTERALGEKKPDLKPVDQTETKVQPVADMKPAVVAEVKPEVTPPAKTVKIAKVESVKAKPAPKVVEVAKVEAQPAEPAVVTPKKTVPAVNVMEVAQAEPAKAKPAELKVAKPLASVEVPKKTKSKAQVVAKAKPEIKPMVAKVSKPDPKSTVAASVGNTAVANVEPKVTKSAPKPMLLADASSVKKPMMAEKFPKTNTQNTTPNTQKTEKSPPKERETTQTTPGKTIPAPAKKSVTISLSSMLEVDKGASAPR